MKFYLSSFRLGTESSRLLEIANELIKGKKRVAYISNALDYFEDLKERKRIEACDIADLEQLGFEVELLDLREYFKKPFRITSYNVCYTKLLRMDLPNNGLIKGMGIPEGITLIAGGGYHGKSTLLNSLELGVYNHILGDGREYVITREDATKIRAEDGRRVEKVNISAFINNLPNNQDTRAFSTDNASGSTSQRNNFV